MTKDKPIQAQDVVLVLPDYPCSSIVGNKGVVQQSMQTGLAVVQFQQVKHWHDPVSMEKFEASSWLIPWKYLKVLDSAYGNSVAELEAMLEQSEDDLTIARSCITLSEELREMQQEQINRMITEIDMLKAEIYYLKGGR